MFPRWMPQSLCCGFTPILLFPSQFNCWLLTKCHHYMQSRAWRITTPDEVVAFWLKYSQWGCGFTSPRQGRKLSKRFISAKIIQRIPPTFANIGFNKIISLLSAPLPEAAVRTSFQILPRPTLHARCWIMPLQMSVMQAEHLSFHANAASGDRIPLKYWNGWLQPRGLLKLTSNQWYSYLKCWEDISEWKINWFNLPEHEAMMDNILFFIFKKHKHNRNM